LQAAKELLHNNDTQLQGLTELILRGRPDLTMESMIWNTEKYHELFTEEELKTCKRRIGI
jgi:hypothetical protein